MRGVAAAMTGASARALAMQSTFAQSSMRVSRPPPAYHLPPAISYLSQRCGPSAFAAPQPARPRPKRPEAAMNVRHCSGD
jgi:hypothetical protein